MSKEEPSKLVHFVGGWAGGTAGAICTCPLEVVKTRLQGSMHAPRPVQSGQFVFRFSTFPALRNIVKNEGIPKLWRGVVPMVLGVAPARALYFTTYSQAKNTYGSFYGTDNPMVHIASAMTAGGFVATAMNPVWLVKTRIQLQTNANPKLAKINKSHVNYTGAINAITRVYREEGIRGFYKGLSASYWGTSESALQFVLYEKIKMEMRIRKWKQLQLEGNKIPLEEVSLNPVEYSVMAGAAKLAASSATYPHEVVRTRLREQRVETSGEKHKYRGLWQAMRLIAKEEGIVALYGGMSAHLMRVVPNAAVMFVTYELVVGVLDKLRQEGKF